MISNIDDTDKKYTVGTKLKLFLKWAGVVVFGSLSVACFLAMFGWALNLFFLIFGHPLNTLIPFLQFLAPVLTSYLWTIFGPVIPLVIFAVFVFITCKIYTLKIKEEFVKDALLIEGKKKMEKGEENKDKNKNEKEDKKEDKENKEINGNKEKIKDNNIIEKKDENAKNNENAKKEENKEIKDENKEKKEEKNNILNEEEYEEDSYLEDVLISEDDVKLYYNILEKHKNLNVFFGDEKSKKVNMEIKTKSFNRILELYGDVSEVPHNVIFVSGKEGEEEL